MNSDPGRKKRRKTANSAARAFNSRAIEVTVPLARDALQGRGERPGDRLHLLPPLSPLWPRCQLLMRHPMCSDEPVRQPNIVRTKDTRIGYKSLKKQFPNLYNIIYYPYTTVVNIMNQTPWNIFFRRILIGDTSFLKGGTILHGNYIAKVILL
ncbi:hypothetical protein SEVIR_5G326875v4 [Setaria viridis]